MDSRGSRDRGVLEGVPALAAYPRPPRRAAGHLRRFRMMKPVRISHETIHQALYVQGRGALDRELTACLRTGRALRVPQAHTQASRKKFVTARGAHQ